MVLFNAVVKPMMARTLLSFATGSTVGGLAYGYTTVVEKYNLPWGVITPAKEFGLLTGGLTFIATLSSGKTIFPTTFSVAIVATIAIHNSITQNQQQRLEGRDISKGQ